MRWSVGLSGTLWPPSLNFWRSRSLQRPILQFLGAMMNKSPTRASSTAECPTPSSPYRRILPRDLDMETDPLQVLLDFHRESVVLHEYGEGVANIRLVSALDVAHALA